jgi:hypothetical protein
VTHQIRRLQREKMKSNRRQREKSRDSDNIEQTGEKEEREEQK